jgi:hypothetical protein
MGRQNCRQDKGRDATAPGSDDLTLALPYDRQLPRTVTEVTEVTMRGGKSLIPSTHSEEQGKKNWGKEIGHKAGP